MKSFLNSLIFLLLVNFSFSLQAQDIIGKWKTIDDETGKEKSVVEIYLKNGKAYGKIIKIYDPAKQESICDLCSDDDNRKDQKVMGMEIIRDMEQDDDEWEEGTILDPKNGKVYDCKIWVEDGDLQVRGYIAFFFRTQVWKRVN